jgi:hypothetical protein
MIQLVLDRANQAVDKEHLAVAVVDLNNRVEDWKGLRTEVFGELLRFGTFTVIKGDNGKDAEREVSIIFIPLLITKNKLALRLVPGFLFRETPLPKLLLTLSLDSSTIFIYLKESCFAARI